MLTLADFNYTLPEELIARYPLTERSASRLLCLDSNIGAMAHHQFRGLVSLLLPGDLLIFNNTKVIPARLLGRKISGGKIEVLVERVIDQHKVLVHIKASKAPKVGTVLILEGKLNALVADRQESLFILQFDQNAVDSLEQYGHMPLPPYINRPDEQLDWERYQTVYAKEKGAVAAPTAGLHFDQTLLKELAEKGIEFAYLTLHVGAGTFQPVRVNNITQHTMHAEYIEVSETVCKQIDQVKAQGGRVIAVGTTSVRALETAARSGQIHPYQGNTDIFIYPSFQFHCIDAMVTNFHLPKSSLLMLVSAFAGRENVMRAYDEAINKKYRFFSYGDAMLIFKCYRGPQKF